jgi:YVTN family beta-propeller protein
MSLLSSVLFSWLLAAPAGAASAPVLLQTIQVPGTPGRWDLLQVDPGTHHLFLSASSNGTLDVLDLNSGAFIAQIPGLPLSVSAKGSVSGSNGLAVASNVGKVFVTDQVDNAVHVYDIASNTQTDVIPTTQKGTDSIAYDATDKKVYAANGDSQTITVIDATTDAVVTQIKLPGGPELALWDPFDDTIHQNLAAKNQQAVIDPKTDTIKVVFNMPPGCTPKGAAINPTDQHIVVGCGGAMTVIMDGGNGAILTVNNNVGGSDAVAYNPVDNRFYTASSGNKVAGKAAPMLGVFDAATNTWLANVPTDTSAHTLAVDPATGRVYLAAQKPGTLLVYAAGASVSQLP